MKKNKFLIFLIIILVIAILLSGFYFIVRLNVFPELTNKFNQVSAKIFLEEESPLMDNANPEKKDKIILQSGKIDIENLKYKFVSLDNSSDSKEFELNDFTNTFKIDDIEFSLSDNNRVLTVTGILTRFLSFYNQDNPEIITWSYKNDFPIITYPGVFQNTVVFIDGNTQVHILDLISGSEISSFNSPVYPMGQALAYKESYLFKGLNDSLYGIAFSDYALTKLNDISNNTKNVNPFELTQDVQTKILDNVANWLTSKKEIVLPKVSIYPMGYSPLPVDIDSLKILVYSPDKQGVYTLGLCDENSAFITTYAFVAVFTSTGELRGVSMDYVADRPNIEIHLADDEIYYIVMCKLDQNTDKQQMYFTVK